MVDNNLKFGGAVMVLDKFANNPKFTARGEQTLFQMDNGDVVMFYNDDPELAPLKRAVSSDPDMQVWSAGGVVIPQCVFQSVARDPDTGIFYCAGYKWTGGLGFDAHSTPFAFWKSLDNGVTWTELPGATLARSSDPNSNFYRLYNTNLVIKDGTFHMWFDASNSAVSQWSIAYTYAPVSDAPDFTTHQWGNGITIHYGGAPWAIYIPSRHAWLMFGCYFGDWNLYDTHGGVCSSLRVWWAQDGADLGDPASWKWTGFEWHGVQVDPNNRKSISDPACLQVAGRNSKIIIAYNYDQSYLNLEYMDVTWEEFFDNLFHVSTRSL